MSALAVQGASSSAGKSLLTTALARALRRRGIDVVPFKAQNMSNNARVVDGGEIGTAQYLPTAPVFEALPDGFGFAKGSLLGIYPHGLFEQPELLSALFGAAPARSLERAFEGLADALEGHIDLGALLRRGGIG